MTALLIDHLWQSTVVLAIVAALVFMVRRNEARVRYWLWFLASIKFLVPLSLLGLVVGQIDVESRPDVTSPRIAEAIQEASQPFSLWQKSRTYDRPTARLGSTEGRNSVAQAELSTPVPIDDGVRGSERREPANAASLDQAILAIWLPGTVLLFFLWGTRWWRASSLRKSARPVECDSAVPVMSSNGITDPGVFGIVNPVLLIPEGMLEQLSAEEFDSVIAHELCHVKRCDNLTGFCHLLVQEYSGSSRPCGGLVPGYWRNASERATKRSSERGRIPASMPRLFLKSVDSRLSRQHFLCQERQALTLKVA